MLPRSVIVLVVLAAPSFGAVALGAVAADTLPLIEQVHLSWLTDDFGGPAGDGYAVTFSSKVYFAPAVDYVTTTGARGSVGAISLVTSPTQRDHVYTWSALLPQDAATYTVRAANDPLVTARSFDIARRESDERVRIAFLADQGHGPNGTAVKDAIRRANVSLILHGGDIPYAKYANEWSPWFVDMEDVAARTPWMTAPGNHERECNIPSTSPFNCGLDVYFTRFTMPREQGIHNDTKGHYAFDWGPVRVISVESEAYKPFTMCCSTMQFDDHEEATAFVAARLAERPEAWKIVIFHHSPFSSIGDHNHGSWAPLHETLVPVLEDPVNGADLVLTGHNHAYERLKPLRGGAVVATANPGCEGRGVQYVVSGGGGTGIDEEVHEPFPQREVLALNYSFVALDVTPDRVHAVTFTPNMTDPADEATHALDRFDLERGVCPASVLSAGPARVIAAVPALATIAILAIVALGRR